MIYINKRTHETYSFHNQLKKEIEKEENLSIDLPVEKPVYFQYYANKNK